jgi:tetratricopeptide (TPR) repeat protein
VPVCQAIQHAHQKGIIHRDIKPSNVLVAMFDDRSVPKVIDFGIAKATGQSLTEQTMYTGFGAVVGTPEYMSPEQANINNLDIDTRSDVYSLGVLLYELLTGSTPVDRKSLGKAAVLEILRVVREVEAPRPSAKLSSSDTLPSVAANRGSEPAKLSKLMKGELDWVLLKALEKDRTRRYDTANGLARDIQRYLDDELVEARPPSAGYRLQKIVRRHKAQAITASLLLFALLAGIAGTTVGLFEAKRQEQRALAAADEERKAKVVAEAEKANALKAAEAEKLAKLDADAKHQDAERNLAFAKKGNEILGSVFAGLDPNKIAESDRPLQDVLRENLLKAVKELDGSAIGDPMEVAVMQNTLGKSLLGLGEYELAIEVFAKAMETFKAKLGPEHPYTLTSMNDLATAYQNAGKLDLALPLFEKTLKLEKAKSPILSNWLPYLTPSWLPFRLPFPTDHASAATRGNLAGAYLTAGKLDLAISLFEETLQDCKAKLGPEHPQTLLCVNNLALAYLNAGKPDLALPLLEATLKLTKDKLGPEHPQTLSSMNNLAAAYKDARKLDLALPLFEETLKLSKAKLGPNHPYTCSYMNNLATAYGDAGKLDLALPLSEETLKLTKAKLGLDHPLTLTSMQNLARANQIAGKLDLAISLYEETLKLMKAKLGPNHPNTLKCMHGLAEAYQAAGKFDLVLPLYEETLKLRKATLGPEHPDTLLSMNNLAHCHWLLKRLDKSVPQFEELLVIREKKLGRDHTDTQLTVYNLGVNYMVADRLSEAIPLLEETYRGSKKISTLKLDGEPLLNAYKKSGETAKFIALLKEQLDEARKTLPIDSPKLTEQMARYGRELLGTGEFADAESILRECLAVREKKQPDFWSTFNTQTLLGGALLGQKNYAEAEPLLLKGYEGMKAREKTIPPQGSARIPEALDRIVELYTNWDAAEPDKGYDAKAAEWQTKLVEHKSASNTESPLKIEEK